MLLPIPASRSGRLHGAGPGVVPNDRRQTSGGRRLNWSRERLTSGDLLLGVTVSTMSPRLRCNAVDYRWLAMAAAQSVTRTKIGICDQNTRAINELQLILLYGSIPSWLTSLRSDISRRLSTEAL
jgi:hypothetical protein